VAAARINWHGQDLPVVREIVTLGGVETMVEIPELAEPELRQVVALLAAFDRFEAAVSIIPQELTAGLYIKHGGTPAKWCAYLASLRVPQSKTRQPASMFQPFLRWAKGGRPDTTGLLSKLAAALDEWLELGEKRPSPITSTPGTSEFAIWLGGHRGYTNVAERRRGPSDEDYSESESAGVVLFDARYSWRFPSAKGKKYLALHATIGDTEWYAPPVIFRALGCQFDLDPASPGADKVPWVPAKHHLTIADDGLTSPWWGFVWLNAPYGGKTFRLWLEKFRAHGSGVALTVDQTSAAWWHDLCANADLVLQVRKKIQFLRPPGKPLGTNALGSSLVAYGERGVKALENAATAGLGTLFQPYRESQAILQSKTHAKEKEIAELKARIAALEAENDALKATH